MTLDSDDGFKLLKSSTALEDYKRELFVFVTYLAQQQQHSDDVKTSSFFRASSSSSTCILVDWFYYSPSVVASGVDVKMSEQLRAWLT
jgi:hypothetical protein